VGGKESLGYHIHHGSKGGEGDIRLKTSLLVIREIGGDKAEVPSESKFFFELVICKRGPLLGS